MAKYKSRATRCGECVEQLRGIAEEIRGAADELNALETFEEEEVTSIIDEIPLDMDYSELESLRDEIENWKSGLEGTNLENSQKYQTLEECYDTLDSAISTLECVSFPSISEKITKEEIEEFIGKLESVADDIESGCDEAEGIEFPSMY